MNQTRNHLSLLALALTCLLGSCSVQGIQVPVVRPSPVDLSAYPLLAIDKWEGNGASTLAEEFGLALRNAENPATGEKGFEVMDHSEVDRLLSRMRGTRSAELDPHSQKVLARWRSVDLLIKGRIEDNKVVERVHTDILVDDKGRKMRKNTRRATARVVLHLEALDSKDQTIDRVTLEGVAKAHTSRIEGRPKAIDPEALASQARRQLVQQYLHRVLPRRVYVRVKLYKDGKLPDLEIGNGYAQTGDWPAAQRAYEQALAMAEGKLAERRYKPLFNLGVAQEYQNQFDAARESLQEAFRIEQDSMIRAEMARVNHREEEFRRLQAQSQPSGPAR